MSQNAFNSKIQRQISFIKSLSNESENHHGHKSNNDVTYT